MKLKKLTPEAVKGKRIAYRVDYNVPLKDGKINDPSRIALTIPTIKFLLKSGAKEIHIFSHLGRPKTPKDEEYSMQILVPELEKLLKKKCHFQKNYTPGKEQIQIHGNLRFEQGEATNDPKFVQKILNTGVDLYINDAFSVCHHIYASVVGCATFLPSYPGFIVQKEVESLSPLQVRSKQKKLTILVGGARLETKLGALLHYAKVAEDLVIGGVLANSFLAFEGLNVGKSLIDRSHFGVIQEIIDVAKENKTQIHLPTDVIVSDSLQATTVQTKKLSDLSKQDIILDLGPETIKNFSQILKKSKEIIWNGPMGLFENNKCAKGTREMLKTISAQKSTRTLVGGGDTLEALDKFGVDRSAFTHVSTGGVAMLEFLEGKELPGIEVLCG